jgi:hypothetical protein
MSSHKPRLNLVLGRKLRDDLQRLADARETSVSQITRDALRHVVRKELPANKRGSAVTRREDDQS